MEIGEIISDAIRYPLNNITAMLIYVVLGIVAALVLVITGVGVGATGDNILAAGGIGLVGLIVALIISLAIYGYTLDIIKIGIERGDGAPSVDILRQAVNGIKLLIVGIVYMIIPILISVILALFLAQWLSSLIFFILCIVFGLALLMAECRLAETESLGYALNIADAIADISKVGLVKIIGVLLITMIISFVLYFIVGLLMGAGGALAYIGAFLMGVIGVYLSFFAQRATGLLYSDA